MSVKGVAAGEDESGEKTNEGVPTMQPRLKSTLNVRTPQQRVIIKAENCVFCNHIIGEESVV